MLDPAPVCTNPCRCNCCRCTHKGVTTDRASQSAHSLPTHLDRSVMTVLNHRLSETTAWYSVLTRVYNSALRDYFQIREFGRIDDGRAIECMEARLVVDGATQSTSLPDTQRFSLKQCHSAKGLQPYIKAHITQPRELHERYHPSSTPT